MVRLKARFQRISKLTKANFNSTMVRLKGELLPVWWQFLLPFQFHYGTIKSALCCYSALAHPVFQFHYGTIKSHIRPENQKK